jgi:predicted RNase H-like nuclease (RuvC/YqgF family)
VSDDVETVAQEVARLGDENRELRRDLDEALRHWDDLAEALRQLREEFELTTEFVRRELGLRSLRVPRPKAVK